MQQAILGEMRRVLDAEDGWQGAGGVNPDEGGWLCGVGTG
jgi:hypothetical protein